MANISRSSTPSKPLPDKSRSPLNPALKVSVHGLPSCFHCHLEFSVHLRSSGCTRRAVEVSKAPHVCKKPRKLRSLLGPFSLVDKRLS